MSINRDMKRYDLEQRVSIRTDSGAEDFEWRKVCTIKVSVYKKNDRNVITSERYLESTHTGLTRYRNIVADKYRIVRDGVCYLITDCNPEGRLTNLLLKAVN